MVDWLTQNKVGMAIVGLCLGGAWWIGKQDEAHHYGADSVPCDDCDDRASLDGITRSFAVFVLWHHR